MSRNPGYRKRDDSARPAETPKTPPTPAEAPAESPSAMPFLARWFLSGAVRHAVAMRKHVQKLLNHQRDILPQQAIDGVQGPINELRSAVQKGASVKALEGLMEKLEGAANKWLKPYPNAAWRENFEVLLVALTVAMGIRTFFLQPFKIPTGSMQPTLYGVTSTNLRSQQDFKFPTGLAAVRDWFAGISYIHQVAQNDGTLDSVDPPVRFLIFNLWQKFVVGGKTYIIWLPPDYGSQKLEDRAGIRIGQAFHKGEDIVKLKVSAGDHLFVDRLSFNFRAPDRGEIIVFETKGIPEDRRLRYYIPGDQFYIKRLVGLGGETLSLAHDYDIANVPIIGTVPVGHLVVNGTNITASTPHFENLYTYFGAPPRSKTNEIPTLEYKENRFFGHAMIGCLGPGKEFTTAKDGFFVMGDNTMNSLDSRYWGDFPQRYVIGKSFFVYWPITERFGWGYH